MQAFGLLCLGLGCYEWGMRPDPKFPSVKVLVALKGMSGDIFYNIMKNINFKLHVDSVFKNRRHYCFKAMSPIFG